ncbi:MAG: hypothetical protein EOM22_11955, partial [Gammaproteobacteria bacterium]|nr:hypothetical protein [Gammaproteobacteria bacterium]
MSYRLPMGDIILGTFATGRADAGLIQIEYPCGHCSPTRIEVHPMFENLQDRFGDVLNNLRGQGRLTEENIKE